MAQQKRYWLKEARERMERKGTVGAFTAWCRRRGYKSTTLKCIAEGKRSKNPTIRKRAQFAARMHEIARKRKKK